MCYDVIRCDRMRCDAVAGRTTSIQRNHCRIPPSPVVLLPCANRDTTQAVPAEVAESLPAHWPFGVKADSDSSSSSDSSDAGEEDGRDGSRSLPPPPPPQPQPQQQQQQQQQREEDEEEADTDSGGEGALPSSAITARQDDMAQQAVDALNEAQGLMGPWQQPHHQQQEQTPAAVAVAAAVPAAGARGAASGAAAGGAADPAPGGSRFAGRMRRVLRLSRKNVAGGVRGACSGGTAFEMEEGGTPRVRRGAAVANAPVEGVAARSPDSRECG